MSVVRITMEGQTALLVGLNRFIERARHWKPTFEKLEKESLGIFRKRFESAGPGWPLLKSATEAQKAKEGGGPSRILIRMGDLYGSFVKGASGNVSRIDELTAEFGSSIPYGVFHQEGRGVPERTIIEITGENEARFEEIAVNDLVEEAKSLGFEVAA